MTERKFVLLKKLVNLCTQCWLSFSFYNDEFTPKLGLYSIFDINAVHMLIEFYYGRYFIAFEYW